MVKFIGITIESDLLAVRLSRWTPKWVLIDFRVFWYPVVVLAWLGMIGAPTVCLAIGLEGLGLFPPRSGSPSFDWFWWFSLTLCIWVVFCFAALCIGIGKSIIRRRLKVEWLMFTGGFILAGLLFWWAH